MNMAFVEFVNLLKYFCPIPRNPDKAQSLG